MAGDSSSTLEAREAEIRSAHERGDMAAAATAIISGYGPEVMGFLVARLGHPSDGSEVFSLFCEDVWKGLPGFAWRSSARGWCYAIARNAANRYATAPTRHPDRNITLSHEEVSRLAQQVRTRTLAFLRTEVKDGFQKLREELSPEDRTLLILRIDKRLPWREIAAVMLSSDEHPELPGGEQEQEQEHEEQLRREEARCRKRLQLVKDRLRALAEERGLLAPDPPR